MDFRSGYAECLSGAVFIYGSRQKSFWFHPSDTRKAHRSQARRTPFVFAVTARTSVKTVAVFAVRVFARCPAAFVARVVAAVADTAEQAAGLAVGVRDVRARGLAFHRSRSCAVSRKFPVDVSPVFFCNHSNKLILRFDYNTAVQTESTLYTIHGQPQSGVLRSVLIGGFHRPAKRRRGGAGCVREVGKSHQSCLRVCSTNIRYQGVHSSLPLCCEGDIHGPLK